jgi:hypothetical protein
MERALVGTLFFSLAVEALLKAVAAVPPADWVPVWLYVGSQLFIAPIFIWWGFRIWRPGL